VKRRLPVEDDVVIVAKMPLNDIAQVKVGISKVPSIG